MLKSNRLKTLESEINKPKLISTREEMIKIQNAKLARQLNLPYSTYEIYKTFYRLGMATTYPQINLILIFICRFQSLAHLLSDHFQL